MLQTLKIKNFALIADQTIEFSSGFNVLIGETGAGKSLILDALSFAMGEKSNKLNIRHGEEKMLVQAVFDNNSQIEHFLEQNNIDVEDSLIISRSLTREGKSDARINGVIVPATLLKRLSEKLVDTYAQNENVELLSVKKHIEILDKYCSLEITNLKQEISNLVTSIKEIDVKIEKLGGDDELRARKLELLEYQIKDIENANLRLNEDIEIKQEIDKMSNFEKIFENVQLTTKCIEIVNDKISEAERSLINCEKYDNSISNLVERLSTCRIEMLDINDSLMSYNDSGYDESFLDSLNKRYDVIKILKKKYGATIEDINSYLGSIKNEYDDLLFGEEKLNKLIKERQEQIKTTYELCLKLSCLRKTKAKEIEQKVIEELGILGFKNCKFQISFSEIPDIAFANFTKNGLDNVEFLFSANAGESLKSLSKTISGGEMSRFMLAIKNVFANCFESTTLVFDEVDTGISGEIGQKVAERLTKLSINYQLICITHLCQVTAMADNYIFVRKEVRDNNTFTIVSYLNNNEIIKYIAIVSGAQPTEVALRFATELKDKANVYKTTLKI